MPASSLTAVLNAIKRERAYQDNKWGTVDEHPHTIAGWLLVIQGELGEAASAAVDFQPEQSKREILQAIAVGVAALQDLGLEERD